MDEKAALVLANKFNTSQEEIHQAHKEFQRGSDDGDDSPSFNNFLESTWFSVDAVPEPVEGSYGKKKKKTKSKKSKAQVPADDFFDFSEMAGCLKTDQPVVVGKKAAFFDSPDPHILTGAQRQIKSTDFNDFSDDDEDYDDDLIDGILDVNADLPSESTLILSVPRDPVVRVERTSSTADEFAEKMAALSLKGEKMPSGASKSVAFRKYPAPKAGGSKGGGVDVYIPPQVVGF